MAANGRPQVLTILVAIITALSAWSLRQNVRVGNELAALQAGLKAVDESRFRDVDILPVYSEIAALRGQISEMKAVSQELATPLKERLDDYESRLRKIESQLGKMMLSVRKQEERDDKGG